MQQQEITRRPELLLRVPLAGFSSGQNTPSIRRCEKNDRDALLLIGALPTNLGLQFARPLFPKMLVEKAGDFFKCLPRFRRSVVTVILRVRLAFIDLQHRLDASLTKLAMDAHRVA